MNFLFILYGGILGVLIGEIWELKSSIKEIKSQYDESLDEKLKVIDE